jgi:hypothetical protein
VSDIYIKPNPERPGIKLRDPVSRLHVPVYGKRVLADDIWWLRRLADGDAVETTQKDVEAGEAAAAKDAAKAAAEAAKPVPAPKKEG